MQIINKTNNAVIAQEAEFANTPLKRLKGLLGRKALPKGHALIIKPCNSIHTFFMRFSIDVLFVDTNNKIVKIKPCLKPFRLTGIYYNAAYVIELPAGTISSISTTQNDTLFFKD